jgi:hypothetical protein
MSMASLDHGAPVSVRGTSSIALGTDGLLARRPRPAVTRQPAVIDVGEATMRASASSTPSNSADRH